MDRCCDEELSEKHQKSLHLSTIANPVNRKHPIRPQYQAAFLKHIIRTIEAKATEIITEIYEEYFKIVSEPSTDRAFLTFFESRSNLITIKESTSVISNGTTGLSTWPAARVLAEYCAKNRGLFIGKTVLELGCGTGLVGLAVLKTCEPGAYVFSDCHPGVLNLVEDNAEINGLSNFRVLNLAWEEAGKEILDEISADVILGADVVYDRSVIPALVSVLREASAGRVVRTFFACAVRNSETFGAFEDCVRGSGGELRDLDLPAGDIFFGFADVPLRIFEITWRKMVSFF